MLNGKTALITGASRGIGRQIALQMAKNGANIAIVYAGNEALALEVCREAEALGVKAQAYACDIASFEATKAMTDRVLVDFGRVDVLVNNAGITADKLILQMSPDDFDKVIQVNLTGAFYMIKHLYRHFAKQRSGRIINITSVSGLFGNAGQANYASAKAGLIALTKTTARELAGRGITANAIAPGFIQTDMTDAMPEGIREKALENVPLRRIGKADEVASLAVFLSSDNAAYITGEVIRVDGGMCM